MLFHIILQSHQARSFVPIFALVLPLLPFLLSSLQNLQMPRLLRKKFLRVSYKARTALVLDLVLCDDGGFFGFYYAGAVLDALGWSGGEVRSCGKRDMGDSQAGW
jgi:hypothetical protein